MSVNKIFSSPPSLSTQTAASLSLGSSTKHLYAFCEVTALLYSQFSCCKVRCVELEEFLRALLGL